MYFEVEDRDVWMVFIVVTALVPLAFVVRLSYPFRFLFQGDYL
jgi:hypothetical protein